MSWHFHPQPQRKIRGRVTWLVVMEIHLFESSHWSAPACSSSCRWVTPPRELASGSHFSCRVSDSLARVINFGKCQSNVPAFPLNNNLPVSPTPFDCRVLHPAWLHGLSQASTRVHEARRLKLACDPSRILDSCRLWLADQLYLVAS